MSKDENVNRLVEMLMQAHPHGCSTREIADALDITQQSARNYIDYLSTRGIPVYEPESRRFAIDPEDYIRPLRLNLTQAWFLYMLLRRVVRADLTRYASVSSVLTRLLSSLHHDIADHIEPETSAQPTTWDDILNRLVEGWHRGRLVRISYRPLNAAVPSSMVIAPYSFEPAVWTDSHYVVAGLPGRAGNGPIMLKLDRIEAAELLSDTFSRPEWSELMQRIDAAWGIWDGEPTTVRLRFSYRVKTRVLETRWHPTQVITTESDGSLIWTAQIAEPRELMPWVRSWGADVEVIGPQTLRAEIAADAQRVARLYGRNAESDEQFF
jgi:CRISPR-associated endonuclease/helicase Cas3